MENLTDGLILSVLGLGTTFAALGFLVLLIILLDHIFNSKTEQSRRFESTEKVEQGPQNVDRVGVEKEAVAAAIAVMVSYQTKTKEKKDLGKILEMHRGAWWSALPNVPGPNLLKSGSKR